MQPQPDGRKPFYRSLSFLLGLAGFLGILALWLDSCRHETTWYTPVVPGKLSLYSEMRYGSMGCAVWTGGRIPKGPGYLDRKPCEPDAGVESPTRLEWQGNIGTLAIRMWKLVALYLAAWLAVMGWRTFRYRQAAREPQAA